MCFFKLSSFQHALFSLSVFVSFYSTRTTNLFFFLLLWLATFGWQRLQPLTTHPLTHTGPNTEKAKQSTVHRHPSSRRHSVFYSFFLFLLFFFGFWFFFTHRILILRLVVGVIVVVHFRPAQIAQHYFSTKSTRHLRSLVRLFKPRCIPPASSFRPSAFATTGPTTTSFSSKTSTFGIIWLLLLFTHSLESTHTTCAVLTLVLVYQCFKLSATYLLTSSSSPSSFWFFVIIIIIETVCNALFELQINWLSILVHRVINTLTPFQLDELDLDEPTAGSKILIGLYFIFSVRFLVRILWKSLESPFEIIIIIFFFFVIKFA